MTLGNFFFQGDLQTLVNYDSFKRESTPSFVNIPFEQREDVTKRCQMNPKHWIHSQNGLTLCSNIRIFTLKNGVSLLWNLWLVCGKMINSSLESAVCKTPHIIKHSGRYSNFRPIAI